MNIECIELKEWNEIEKLEIEFPTDIFRGQADSRWEISSALSRTLINTDFNHDPNNVEFWFLREFKRRASHYLPSLPENNDTIGWLSLMQHYGTPTRLIDFSHSFYVACYFALISAKTDAAIWAIDPMWLLNIGHKTFKLRSKGLRDEHEDNVYKAGNDFLNKALATASNASSESTNPSYQGVIPVEPFQFNKRLGAQQGLFALPLDLTISFMDNLTDYVEISYPKIRKIEIKYSLRERALAHLKEMNITSETLFPGIEGFAKSLTHKHLCT